MKAKPNILRRRHKGAILAVCFAAITVVMLLTSTIFFMVQGDTATTALLESRAETRREVAAIGEQLVAGTLDPGSLPEGYTCETVTAEDGSQTTMILKRGDTLVLRVTVSAKGKILAWETNPKTSSEPLPDAGTGAGEETPSAEPAAGGETTP